MVELARRRWPFFAISVLGLSVGVAGVLRARLDPQISAFHLAVLALEGLIFLAVNLIVFAPRVDRGPVRDLYWCTLLYGMAVMLGAGDLAGAAGPRSGLGPIFAGSRKWIEWALPAIRIACLTALPVLFFRMSQTFPRSRRFLERRPRLMRGLWIVAGILALWQMATVFRYLADPRPGLLQGIALPRLVADVLLILAVGLGCLTLYRSGRKLELARERDQVKWLLWGFGVGAIPAILLRSLPWLTGVTAIPPDLDRLFELAIPVAFASAIVRVRFLDIDIIIRRSLIYGALAAALASVYLLVGGVVARRIIERAPQYAAFIQVLAVAVPVILYAPARRWIEGWVDGTFFTTQHDYAQALLAFQEPVRGASSQAEIAELCRTFLEDRLLIQRAVVLARRGDVLDVVGELAGADPESILDALEGNGNPRRLLASPGSTSRPDLETDAFPEVLSKEGFQLALAICADEKSLGAILLGEKGSQAKFVEEDLKLLHAVRAEAASALERVALVQLAAKEAFFHEHAEDLEGQKDFLFATLAEDLRRPLTVVRWTVETLLERMGHTTSPQNFAELQAIQAASSELDRLVKNLHDLNRPGAGGAREPVRIDLLPLVQEAMASVTAAAKARNIHFELSVAPDLVPVKGHRDMLVEVVLNLLENATRYSPDGKAVEIALDRDGEDGRLIVRDHGPGLPNIHRPDRIFNRFEQGSPSPYVGERGFGLGLYIAKSYLERMRGTIQAGNHPEGGARFVCTLPEWREPPREAHREAQIGLTLGGQSG